MEKYFKKWQIIAQVPNGLSSTNSTQDMKNSPGVAIPVVDSGVASTAKITP